MNSVYAGWHLTYDALVSPDKSHHLGDVGFLETAFLDLVKLLEMEVLVAPTFKVVPLNPTKMEEVLEDDGGVTGTCIITTSHISIHTWPLRHRFALDVFSCKEFSPSKTEKFLQARFSVETKVSHWFVRNWP